MLSSLFALSLLGLAACNFLNNDWKSHHPEAVSAYDARQNTGASAHALLSSDVFRSLTVEIQAVQGFEPSLDALNHLQDFLSRYLNKPDGISIVEDNSIPSPGLSSFGINDVRAIEDRHRQYYPHDDHMAIYLLFVDGKSADDVGEVKYVGHAHMNTSIVIYADTLRQAVSESAGSVPLSTYEATVMEHEVGHLLGLVNVGTTSQADHEDPQNHMHCKNTTCLMYYLADTTRLITDGHGAGVPDLDDDCKQDLKVNGGK